MLSFDENLCMDRQKTILSQYGNKKIRGKNFGSSIEPPSAKSYSSVSGRFSHSGSQLLLSHTHTHTHTTFAGYMDNNHLAKDGCILIVLKTDMKCIITIIKSALVHS